MIRYSCCLLLGLLLLVVAIGCGSENAKVATQADEGIIANRGWDGTKAHYTRAEVKHPSAYMVGSVLGQLKEDDDHGTLTANDAISAVSDPFYFFGRVILLPAEACLSLPWSQQVSR